MTRWIIGAPSRYRVAICVWLAPAVATTIARLVLGDDATTREIERLGYGWPTLERGWVWTLSTGMVVVKSLSISFVPSFSFVGVALLEHKASHWRTAVMFVAGQIVGVLLALVLTWPLRGRSGPVAHEMTETVDFGFSVGGFAALGMWTCYLGARLRLPLRLAISCYLGCQLLFSGLIYDVSHPIGWILGIVGGVRLMAPARPDGRARRTTGDVGWAVFATVVGTVAGVVAAWQSGGIGGIFGWGPNG